MHTATLCPHEPILRRFGFHYWGPIEGHPLSEREEELMPHLPCFLQLKMAEIEITFAIDDRLQVWCVEGYVDLCDHGFTQVEFTDAEEDEAPRLLN